VGLTAAWPARIPADSPFRAPCAVLHSPCVGHTAAWRLTIMQPLSCLEARICVVVTTGLAIITVHITVLAPFHNIFSPCSCPIYSCSDLALTTGPIRTSCSCPRLLLFSLEPSHSVSPFPVGPSLTHVTPSPPNCSIRGKIAHLQSSLGKSTKEIRKLAGDGVIIVVTPDGVRVVDSLSGRYGFPTSDL